MVFTLIFKIKKGKPPGKMKKIVINNNCVQTSKGIKKADYLKIIYIINEIFQKIHLLISEKK